MTRKLIAALLCATLVAAPALAETSMSGMIDPSGAAMPGTRGAGSGGDMMKTDQMTGGHMENGHSAAMHGPVGMIGNHLMPAGKVMLSYCFGAMSMSGNRIGTSEVSNDFTATSVPNTFFCAPGQPPTLRAVPQEMTMQMHMVGLMYAPTDPHGDAAVCREKHNLDNLCRRRWDCRAWQFEDAQRRAGRYSRRRHLWPDAQGAITTIAEHDDELTDRVHHRDGYDAVADGPYNDTADGLSNAAGIGNV